MRGATCLLRDCTYTGKFQSTHPMRGATDEILRRLRQLTFQSTHPMRGATGTVLADALGHDLISIHAPHAGCDIDSSEEIAMTKNFNPRTPCGVRPDRYECIFYYKNFNPRTREGCDSASISAIVLDLIFQSTHPRGVRRYCQ